MAPKRPIWQNVTERLTAFVILALLVPLLGMIAALVKLDSPGPCLAQQQRVGLKGSPFYLYRFRVTGGDALTKVGCLLKHSALEGLPQLWNVVAGDLRLLDIEGLRAR